MESAANVLLSHFKHVLVRAAYDNYVRIRFRADAVRNGRVYFNKVVSQHKSWRETGGALITWKNSNLEGPCDAIVLVECPKSLDALYRAIKNTASVAVIYEPPSWRQHEQQIAKRHKEKHPRKSARQLERLVMIQDFVQRLPEFTKRRLRRSLPALAERPRA